MIPVFWQALAQTPWVSPSTTPLSATSTAGTIVIPAAATVGDLAILTDFASNGASLPTSVTPPNWTNATDNPVGTGFRAMTSYKVLTSGDLGLTITGMVGSGNQRKVMVVLHPARPIRQVISPAWNNEGTANNPAAQTVTVTGQGPVIVVIGCAVANVGTVVFVTQTPAFDGTVNNGSMIIGWKIYNSQPPPVHTIDMDDFGSNILVSGYLKLI